MKFYASSGSTYNALKVITTHRYLLGKVSYDNIFPVKVFNYRFAKKIITTSATSKFKPLVTPWYYANIIRFFEFLSGRKVLLQFYPFMSQEVEREFMVRYKL